MKTLAKWSVSDYHQMVTAGILANRQVELLAGEIIEKVPETPLHYNVAKRDSRYLETLLQGKADVRFNGPITLADSEPEPDIAIVRLPESAYDTRHPYAEDIYWVVEVARTSLQKDLTIKAAIYAAAEIPEYWVLDLKGQQLRVLRDPVGDKYETETVYESGVLKPLAFPEISVSISKLLS
ncbi:Uma2 family endonuclease [Leptothoe sp. PORK10 BA2]|uniref:Uma2 family endonuclease n=1 Tax=Leptothoe sp. PORK10 BA2 TaxID=3110254 RepID=UPI002B207938|nr:Uma2 family endonuclease [Leptothoe sp. PORK10 BA2]MEA5462862.1 Uma2 family endonuclease [Leptothoe sp. PORK10 BA2]